MIKSQTKYFTWGRKISAGSHITFFTPPTPLAFNFTPSTLHTLNLMSCLLTALRNASVKRVHVLMEEVGQVGLLGENKGIVLISLRKVWIHISFSGVRRKVEIPRQCFRVPREKS